MIEVQICDYCRSCNIDTLEITVLVEKECVDCGVDTDYAYKH